MADVKMVWLRNMGDHSVQYITRKDGTNPVVSVTVPAVLHDIDGSKISDNVVSVSESAYEALLARCPIFKMDITKGIIRKTDTAPASVKTATKQIEKVLKENAALKEQLKTATSASGIEDTNAKLAAALKEIEALKAKADGAGELE